MDIIAHTMHYSGGKIAPEYFALRNYLDSDYPAYSEAYNACFADMRRALGLTPIDCCDTREALLDKSENIFILQVGHELAGSVAIYGGEIDDLFVAKSYQRKGYGGRLLRFAAARMQREGLSPITLHVADWNRGAIRLYTRNGFRIVKTETV